jgi:hypothetical protein
MKIIFCLLTFFCAHNSLAMLINENNKKELEENGYEKIQKAIDDVFEENLAVRSKLELARNKYIKYNELFTNEEKDKLLRTAREITKYLNAARNVKDSVLAEFFYKTNTDSIDLSWANTFITRAKNLLGEYENIIKNCFNQDHLIMLDNLQSLYKKNQQLFTEQEQNGLSKLEEEITKHLNNARDAKRNANAIDSNNSYIKNMHLFHENEFISKAKKLLDDYKNTIDARIQPTAKL